MNILKKKAQIAYILTAFLDRQAKFSQQEIDTYIGTMVKFDVREDPRLATDHLRRAMIELGYLERTPDGRQYWVSGTFVSLLDQETANITLISSKIGTTESPKVSCPFCQGSFRVSVLMGHYSKRHTFEKTWAPLIEEYFA